MDGIGLNSRLNFSSILISLKFLQRQPFVKFYSPPAPSNRHENVDTVFFVGFVIERLDSIVLIFKLESFELTEALRVY